MYKSKRWPLALVVLTFLFNLRLPAQDLTTLHDFGGDSQGASPSAGLLQAGATFCGTTQSGGDHGQGTVFSINADGTGYTTLYSFSGNDGANPSTGLILSEDGTLYGTTRTGGAHYNGTVFSINTNGADFTTLHSFSNNEGYYPYAGLVLSGDTLYGTTREGGDDYDGTVFSINTDGSGFTTLYNFSGNDGSRPSASLLLSNDTLYGTTQNGGDDGQGTVFSINTDGDDFTTLHSFSGNEGNSPSAALILSEDGTLYGTTQYGGYSYQGTVFMINTNGTGFDRLHSFSGGDGAYPQGALLLSGATLYGTTSSGGINDQGTVFMLKTNGIDFALVNQFSGPEGASPQAELIVSSNTLYSTTSSGGANGQGVIFSLNHPLAMPAIYSPMTGETITHSTSLITGTLNTNTLDPDTTVQSVYYSLNGGVWTVAVTTDGWYNWSAPTNFAFGANTLSVYAQDTAGNNSATNTIQFTYLHVTYPAADAILIHPTATVTGTMETNVPIAGVYYSLNGAAWTLASTTNDWYDWSFPATLILGSNTVSVYGRDIHGVDLPTNTIQFAYRIFPIIHYFDASSETVNPRGALVQVGNRLYGASFGQMFAVNVDGTDYQMISSTAGALWGLVGDSNRLYGATASTIFAINPDGSDLTTLATGFSGNASLALSGNTLYGVTDDGDPGGSVRPGTLYSVQTNGSGFTQLHAFTGPDGDSPRAGMTVSGSKLYGTTSGGGDHGSGTVFSINANGTGFTVLGSFPSDGITIEGNVAVADNVVYGTILGNNAFKIFSVGTDGSDFTILYTEASNSGGSRDQYPGLIVVSNVIYGCMTGGGAYGHGQIFALNTDGTGFTNLYSFTGSPDGDGPQTDLLLIGYTLYGTTISGGPDYQGTVFGVNVPALTPDVFTARDAAYHRNGLPTWQINVSDLLTNVTDSGSNPFALADVSPSTNGITLTNNLSLIQYYNPNLVDDQFTYTVTNNIGLSATGVVTLIVASVDGHVNQLTLSSGVATIGFSGLAGYRYHIQVSTNLTDWTTLETTNAPANGSFQFIDLNPRQPATFYRLMWNGD